MNLSNNIIRKVIVFTIYTLGFISFTFSQKSNGFKYKPVSNTLISKYFDFSNKVAIPVGAVVLNDALFTNKTVSVNSTIVQKALNENSIVVLPNTSISISKEGIKLNSNNILIFQNNSELIIESNALAYYELLKVHNVSNVKILNAQLKGDRKSHKGNSGEWGYGISIRNSSNVIIDNFKIENFWGDGIAVGYGTTKTNRDIVLRNGFLDYNRRNGISIMNVDGLTIENILVTNTNGVNPMFGIDFEPNNIHDNLRAISLNNIYSYNNANGGLMLTFSKLKAKSKKSISFSLNNFRDIGSPNGLMLAGVPKEATGLEGQIKISNVVLDGNKSPITGRTVNNNKVKVSIDNLKITNPVNKNVSHKEVKRVFGLKSNYSIKFSD